MQARKFLWIIPVMAAATVGWLYLRPSGFSHRVYRIGWMISPPFQVRGANGQAAGISVDLVNMAAQRRGIRLEWVYWNDSSESALITKSVDLWPLITITPERLKLFHISAPYLQHEHCLLVRDDSAVARPSDLATARIGMANVSIDAHHLRSVLPGARPAPAATVEAVLEDVCRGATDAGFMDRFTAIGALLQQPGCGGHSLRWITVPQLRSQLGVGATFEASSAAEAIRSEIGALAQEGKLAGVFGQWGFMSGQDEAAMESLINVKRREAFLFFVALLFAALFSVACWQSVRLVRERTRTRRTEEALRESQERYLQAQKLESIGRLAGGVAHDFNNLLTVINGYGDLLLRQLPAPDPKRAFVEEIRNAGERAADLTRQLLTFGRKQVGRPARLNLNNLIEESDKMLRRLLGEDIRTVTKLDPALGLVMADPGNIHQVLMNLAVNARDAMPTGGTLVIETANEYLDQWPDGTKSESRRGPAVRLSVSDTGQGMSAAVLENIFEPFFTTKGNLGTGLGLATVYGIVRQSQGWIDVASEPGKGSTFRVYLPRVEGAAEPPRRAPAVPEPPRGSATILVVEDQEEVRRFVVRALADCGYQVLAASDGEQAVSLAERISGKIDVLLTDVVLPGINGREVAERIVQLRPGIKVIYTSGYTQDLIANRGVLDHGVAYVPKPYTAEQIAAKVRETIQNG